MKKIQIGIFILGISLIIPTWVNAIPNPELTDQRDRQEFCEIQGYTYKSKGEKNDYAGDCFFSDGTSCDGREFYDGAIQQKTSYCGKDKVVPIACAPQNTSPAGTQKCCTGKAYPASPYAGYAICGNFFKETINEIRWFNFYWPQVVFKGVVGIGIGVLIILIVKKVTGKMRKQKHP